MRPLTANVQFRAEREQGFVPADMLLLGRLEVYSARDWEKKSCREAGEPVEKREG
jgi:hypothetical protein